MEWRRYWGQRNPSPPEASPRASYPCSLDHAQGERIFPPRREEEEDLREQQRRQKRERLKKQRREKKERAEKKRRQKNELRLREEEQQLHGLQRSGTLSAASTSGGIGAVVHASHNDSDLPDATIIASSAGEEALSSRSEEQQEHEENLNLPVFASVEDFFEYLCENDRVLREKAGEMPEQPLVDKFESQLALEPDQSRLILASEDAQPIAAHGQKCTKEEIAQNGKKWMIEEVMVAFQKYRKRKNDLKDLDYEFDELHHQCFNVETYDKIFHHFNFTVKMKEPSSSDWISTLYFAEVKEIFSHKIYFCSPLEPYENGLCYACKNQGIDDLKHPIIGAFDRGSPDSKFPFMYDDDSDYDDFDI